MLAVFVLLPLKSVLTPRKYPQNPGFSENRTKKERAQLASSQKQNRGLSCTLRFVILLLNLNGPVNRALDDRQKFFRAEFARQCQSILTCFASVLRDNCLTFRASFTFAPKVSKPGQSLIFAIQHYPSTLYISYFLNGMSLYAGRLNFIIHIFRLVLKSGLSYNKEKALF